MRDTMIRELYWPHMKLDMHATVGDYCDGVFSNDRFMKLTGVISSLKSTVSQVEYIFFNHFVVSYKEPAFLPKHHSLQFEFKLFEILCMILGLNNL